MMENRLTLEQHQTLSLKQVQSLDILTLTNQELEDFLMNEYLENPMLESFQDKESDMLTNVETMYEKGMSYKEQYMEEQEEDNQRKSDIAAVSGDELKEFLQGQMIQEEIPKRQWDIMNYLIDCLDSGGFFPYDIDELSKQTGILTEELKDCLNRLKELEPVGIFSKDLSECLQIQLRKKGIEDEKLFAILEDYLPDLMNGRISVISRKLKLSTATVKEYIHLIGSLNPRPVMNMPESGNEYIIPDIIAVRHNGRWEVRLNDQWMGEYKYNEYYIRMMEESNDAQLKEYFREKLERARFVIHCVEQRRKTILRIAETVLEIQEGYFEHQEALKPMSLEDVASLLQIHASTVSRAIRGKYIQYKKTVLLKELFQTEATRQDGIESISSEKVKIRIKELIEKEPNHHPLSDQKLAELLKEEGIAISRRAVAKYRMQMGILDSRQRGIFRHEE